MDPPTAFSTDLPCFLRGDLALSENPETGSSPDMGSFGWARKGELGGWKFTTSTKGYLDLAAPSALPAPKLRLLGLGDGLGVRHSAPEIELLVVKGVPGWAGGL